MRIMRWSSLLALIVVAGQASAQDYVPGEQAEARIWLDRGSDPLLQRGERVRVYYRTSEDAHVAIFQIDTDGVVRLLHPRAPGDETFTRGGRDYRLLFSQSSYWYVDEYPGKGYYFMVASPEPFDLGALAYARHEGGWDLTHVGRTVYRDPYLAMDDYVARLIPDWETVPYALDFIAYDVGEVHEYPRFLCYDCHGFRSYTTWNPYTYACASFRVVVWDDPYFYPAFRYRGARVVYAQPRRGVPMFGFKERAVGETWAPLVRTRQPPLRRATEYVEPDAARSPLTRQATPRRPSATPDPGVAAPRTPSGASPSVGQPVPRRVTPSGGTPSGSTRTATPTRSAPPAATPRPGTTAPTRPSTQARPSDPGTSGERPVLQRRPSGATAPPPSGGSSGGRVVRPSSGVRPPASGSSAPAARRPSNTSGGSRVVTPPASGGSSSRPAIRPPSSSAGGSRPSVSPSRPSPAAAKRPPPAAAKKPPPRRKPGGGDG